MNFLHRFRNSARRDDGAALALVIIMLIILSVWLAAASTLTQSTGTALAQNAAQSARRASLVNEALSQTLDKLTPPEGLLLGVGPELDITPERIQSCTASGGGPKWEFDDRTTSETERILVYCWESSDSGAQKPIASFTLTGSGTDLAFLAGGATQTCQATGSCVTGQDGGLLLTGSGQGAPSLRVSGGLINVAGAWKKVGVAQSLLLMQKPANAPDDPEIFVPQYLGAGAANDKQCPAGRIGSGGAFLFADADLDAGRPCQCPPYTGAARCYLSAPDVKSLTNLSAEVRGYSRSTEKLIKARDLPRYVDTPIQVPADTNKRCADWATDSTLSRRWDNNPAMPFVLVIDGSQGGRIGPAELAKLDQLTNGSGCIGDGTAADAPLLVLTGVFRFVADATPGVFAPGSPLDASATGNLWTVKRGGSRNTTVIGGEPLPVGQFGCSKVSRQHGVNLLFGAASYVDFTSGQVALCARAGGSTVVVTAPQDPTLLGFRYQGIRTQAWLTAKSASTFRGEFNGLVYAPGAFADAYFGNLGTGVLFNGGAVLKALQVTVNSSASASGEVSPPLATNGDRRVQLRFCLDNCGNGDLGMVQVAIQDRYGDAPGSGYQFSVWRTQW